MVDRQYRRVSTEEQEKGTSLEWQLAKLAEVSPNAIDYCDGGCTGTNGNRPQPSAEPPTKEQMETMKRER